MPGLQREIWVAGIQENPVPDHSFVIESRDMSEYVNNNTLHLAEAGIEPGVHEDFFAASDDPLPFADVSDIPNEVVLHTYSTEQTRHRDLQEVELAYDRRASVINRHRTALGKNIGRRAAHAWAPQTDGGDNAVKVLGNDSIIDAIIDLEAFYGDRDIVDGLNICFTPQHMAKLKKEDYKLYKQVLNEKQLYGFKVHRYSQNPLYTSVGAKKPFGAVAEEGDVRGTFTWVKDEVFRCFGTTEMYATLRDSGTQSDTLSFAQRALVGKIRANSPKYLGAIV
ncbi:hypothetical protein QP547_04655 [Weeksella virosa]|uniref:hypothetical protein n=1 Tax=Weeksella virosa TaxID=1014 RepID=UPI0025576C12|nr:hypothetical protein [Weeksella virosa]MDK7675100.1 hypothetical protein [Weeksella virosa]